MKPTFDRGQRDIDTTGIIKVKHEYKDECINLPVDLMIDVVLKVVGLGVRNVI